MNISIATTIRVFGLLICVGLIAIVSLSTVALTQLEVTGPVYTQIKFGQELLADIEPPQMYMVEAFLDANLAARYPADFVTYKAELAWLHQQYNDRHEYWTTAGLPAKMSAQLNQGSDADVQQFWKQMEGAVLPAIASGNQAQISQAMAKLNLFYEAHRTIVQNIVVEAQAYADANQAMAARKVKLYTRIVMAGSGLVLLAIIFGLWIISLKVLKPVNKMADYMTVLAGGDFEAEIPYQKRRDEIGDMVHAVVIFRDAIVNRRLAEESLAAARTAAEVVRVKHDEERAAAAEALSFVVDALAKGLVSFANGDLTYNITTWFNPDYKTLRMDFNDAVAKMAATMRRISVSTTAVEACAGDILQASSDFSRRSEQQAALLAEASAALGQITATVENTSSTARIAAELATSARSHAIASSDVVRDTMSAMGGIETSSRQIGSIIGVIDELAFKTNLLALNAGIEAERAGEAGRDFAVVATEVQTLAQRSANAAMEIKAIISTSGRQVETGVKLVDATGKALLSITERVDRLSNLVSEIALAAAEQALGLNQINLTKNEMDQVIQQNDAIVQQTSKASRSLAAEAAGLTSLVAEFYIGEVDAGAQGPVLVAE